MNSGLLHLRFMENLQSIGTDEARRISLLLREVSHFLSQDEEPEPQRVTRSRKALALETRVQIIGLRDHTPFNGSVGRVKRSPNSTSERYDVQLEPRYGGNLLRVREDNVRKHIEQPSKGYVLLHSIKSRPELNGQSAEVIESNRAAERITVSTGEGSVISVPSSCVLPLVAPAHIVQQSGSTSEAHAAPNHRCCVCLENISETTVADPCGHTDVCLPCSVMFPSYAPCPICRSPVEKYVRLFTGLLRSKSPVTEL